MIRFLSILAVVICFAPATSGEAKSYPKHWWKPLPAAQTQWWEVPPQAAKPGEVILSKRNELGIFSNFSPTAFTFRGKRYPSIEGFWQMMKFPEGKDDPRATFPGLVWKHTRQEVSQMVAFEAKEAGDLASENMKTMRINWVTFEGERIPYRVHRKGKHYRLVVAVIKEKLKQNPKIKPLLLATGNLKLRPDHIVTPRDPAAWRYFDVWMELRTQLQKKTTSASD